MGDPDDEGEVEGVDTPSVPTSSQDVDKCAKCGRGESDGITEALNVAVDSDLPQWIGCDSCFLWYHVICVGLNKSEDYSDVQWKCPAYADLWRMQSQDL